MKMVYDNIQNHIDKGTFLNTITVVYVEVIYQPVKNGTLPTVDIDIKIEVIVNYSYGVDPKRV